MTRYVLYHPEWGVYLGNFMGLGFWSGLDPAGQDMAPTFESRAEALLHVATWDEPARHYETREVEVHELARLRDNHGAICATVAECVAAGLPAWRP